MFEYHAEAEPPQGDFLGSVMAAGSISKHACTHMRERESERARVSDAINVIISLLVNVVVVVVFVAGDGEKEFGRD